MRKTVMILAALLCAAQIVAAQDVIGEGAGSVAMGFVAIPRNASSLAAGGVVDRFADFHKTLSAFAGGSVFAPSDEDIRMSGFYGSALFSGSDKMQIGVSAFRELGTAYEWDGANGGGPYTQEVHQAFGAELRYEILSMLSVRAGFNYLQQRFNTNDPWTAVAAADLHAEASFVGLRVQAGVSNLGFGKVESESGQKFDIPCSIDLAAFYGLSFGKSRLDARAGANYYLYGASRLGAGLSYTFNGLISVLGGFNYGGDSPLPDFVSLGAGLNIIGINANLTYLMGDGLCDGAILLQIGYKF